MAITYPLTLPTTGISSVEFRTVNANATSQSPFTFKQQVISHGGQQLSATVNLAPMRRAEASVWKAALISLKGSLGTFLLGDPNYCFPRGTLRSTSAQQFASVSGNAGDTFFTITMTNQSDTLLAGDYIQVGLESGARLYQVLEDQTGDGTIEVFPNLRTNYVDELVGTNDPKGVFRLSNNVTSWSIDNASVYGISFDCVEAITG
jgi:hypothetical protein